MFPISTVLIDMDTTRDNENVYFSKVCSITNKKYEVKMSLLAFVEWKYEGKLLQYVLPEYSADDREFLITGWTPAEWHENIGKYEDD